VSVVPPDTHTHRILAEEFLDQARPARLSCPLRLDRDPVSSVSPHLNLLDSCKFLLLGRLARSLTPRADGL
jgi:hypothetical protein